MIFWSSIKSWKTTARSWSNVHRWSQPIRPTFFMEPRRIPWSRSWRRSLNRKAFRYFQSQQSAVRVSRSFFIMWNSSLTSWIRSRLCSNRNMIWSRRPLRMNHILWSMMRKKACMWLRDHGLRGCLVIPILIPKKALNSFRSSCGQAVL